VKTAYVPASQFSGLSCPALLRQQASLTAQVNRLSKSQRNARNGDIVGVVLIGLPVSSMTGNDVEKDLAKARGELLAVADKIEKRGC
jgi:hypothetical protein